jgi:hypothetical protein
MRIREMGLSLKLDLNLKGKIIVFHDVYGLVSLNS